MRPFKRLLNGYGMVVSTSALVKRFINLHPFRFVMLVYALNYIINIYCLRMSDIAGAFMFRKQSKNVTISRIVALPLLYCSCIQSWPEDHLWIVNRNHDAAYVLHPL